MKFLTITWAQAFGHCASTSSYWICLVIGVILAGVIGFFTIKNSQSGGWKNGHSALLFLAIALAALSIVYRPGEIKVNTSPEQAARGVFIGY